MSNAETILEFLEESRKGVCDDCISRETRVEPRQQVYQICRQLEHRGTVTRRKDSCALCGHTKTVNIVCPEAARPDVATPLIAAQAQGDHPGRGEAMSQRHPDDNEEKDTSRSIAARISALKSQLEQLLNSPAIPFNDHCRNELPERHGIYRIFDPTKPDETVRAGRTKTAAGGLRQRVYQNHLMGNQDGNLRAQLVADGVCPDPETAKRFIRESLAVQILVVEDEEERTWLEHFMLGVLRPRYCD